MGSTYRSSAMVSSHYYAFPLHHPVARARPGFIHYLTKSATSRNNIESSDFEDDEDMTTSDADVEM